LTFHASGGRYEAELSGMTVMRIETKKNQTTKWIKHRGTETRRKGREDEKIEAEESVCKNRPPAGSWQNYSRCKTRRASRSLLSISVSSRCLCASVFHLLPYFSC
jgi:hypothetical protein